MSEVQRLVGAIGKTTGCQVIPPRGAPVLRARDRVPDDLLGFYRLCGGVRLFEGSTYPIRIVEPDALVRANPEIVGAECPDDITDSWYIVAREGEIAITIDCDVSRLGRCYDSFWDCHGVAGSCPVVALSFTELLRRLFESEGKQLYWVVEGAPDYGDAYADVDGTRSMKANFRGRSFKLWQYRVSHGELLVRSPRDDAHARNVDIMFVAVEYVDLPYSLPDLEIDEPNEADVARAGERLGKPIEPRQLTILTSRGRRYLVVGVFVEAVESDMDILESPFESSSSNGAD